jgi:choline kinase
LKAVIIAAGRGSRIGSPEDSKPLVSINGLSLIERAILNCKRNGISEVLIVIGYNKEKIKEKLGSSYSDVKISYIYNEEWNRGNAISVLKTKDYLKEPFILMMSDHILDENILNMLLKTSIKEDECILCVDKSFPSYINMSDATKVLIDGKKIKKIGKNIEKFNGIDTGIFKCQPSLFDVIENSIKSGGESLSNSIQILSDQNRMLYCDIGEKFWIDVDDNIDLKNAEFLLKTENLKKYA